MVSSSSYAAEPVQPRRPGPPPARLDLQGLRPDHGDQAGDRPLHDLLHLETARPQPAPLGPLGSPHRRRGLPGDGSTSQQATVASDNTVFAQLDLDVGPEHVAATAKSMGITSPLDGIPAEGIGGLRVGVSPLELADAYATLASGGIHHDPVAIEQGRLPRRQGRPPGTARTRTGALRSGRLRGDPAAARQHHRRDRDRRLHRLRRARRARPGPPTATPTPGSPATSRTWRPRSGSATRSRTRSK